MLQAFFDYLRLLAPGEQQAAFGLLAKQTAFVSALVACGCDVGEAGKWSMCIVAFVLMRPDNREVLFAFPGLLDALVDTPHTFPATVSIGALCDVEDEAQRVALTTNAALVDLLIARMSLEAPASRALSYLCSSQAVPLYAYPGLVAAVASAVRVQDCAAGAVGVFANMSNAHDALGVPMLGNPLVLDALHFAASSYDNSISDNAIGAICNLSLPVENRGLMRDDERIMELLVSRADNEYVRAQRGAGEASANEKLVPKLARAKGALVPGLVGAKALCGGSGSPCATRAGPI